MKCNVIEVHPNLVVCRSKEKVCCVRSVHFGVCVWQQSQRVVLEMQLELDVAAAMEHLIVSVVQQSTLDVVTDLRNEQERSDSTIVVDFSKDENTLLVTHI